MTIFPRSMAPAPVPSVLTRETCISAYQAAESRCFPVDDLSDAAYTGMALAHGVHWGSLLPLARHQHWRQRVTSLASHLVALEWEEHHRTRSDEGLWYWYRDVREEERAIATTRFAAVICEDLYALFSSLPVGLLDLRYGATTRTLGQPGAPVMLACPALIPEHAQYPYCDEEQERFRQGADMARELLPSLQNVVVITDGNVDAGYLQLLYLAWHDHERVRVVPIVPD